MKKLGFGGMRFPLLNPDDKTSIDQEQVNAMADAFLDAGFTYFDTAYLYHDEASEPAFKKALTDRHKREEFILADKMPTVIVRKPEDYAIYFQNQLDRTGAGYFDYYLMHNMGKDRYDVNVKFGGFDFIREQIAAGKIRHFGFSFHDDPETLDRILTEQPEVEFVQLQINYLDWDNEVIQSRKCYETCVKHGKKIIVMEPVKGGTLANLPKEAEELLRAYNPDASPASYALRFAAGLENVMMVLSGMSNMEQMQDNISFMRDFKPLDETERAAVEKVQEIFYSKNLIPCTACRYCTDGCPKHISIPDLFAIMNTKQIHHDWNADCYYEDVHTAPGRKASDCLKCGKCEKVCPQHLPIRKLLEQVAAEFEKAPAAN